MNRIEHRSNATRHNLLTLAFLLGSALLIQSHAWAQGGSLLGSGAITFEMPDGITDAIDVAASQRGGAVIRAGGSLVVWGTNPETVGDIESPAVMVEGLAEQFVALRENGTISLTGRIEGSLFEGLDREDLIDVGITFIGLAALRSDGTVEAWGLRAGPGTPLHPPEGLDQVVDISLGASVGIALKADGTIVQWGQGNVPQPPAGLTDVIAVETGDRNVVALRADGTIATWGSTDIPPQGLLPPIASISAGIQQGGAMVDITGNIVSWPTAQAGVLQGVVDVSSGLVGGNDMLFIQAPGALPFAKIMPGDIKRIPGSSIVLKAHATGANTYQWMRDGLPIAGATKPWFFIESLDRRNDGEYTLVMTNFNGTTETEPVVVTQDLNDQRLTVGQIMPRQFGDPPFDVFANASSGLPVHITVSGPGALEGNTVSITGNGTLNIRFEQSGNFEYEPAEPVVISFDTGSAPGPYLQLQKSDSGVYLEVPWFSTRPIGIEYSPDMTPGSWIEIGNASLVNGVGVFSDADLQRAGRHAGFYRAFLRLPPN